MFWAVAALCFFGFFRSGEITVPSEKGYTAKVHLSWGDVRIDSQETSAILLVFLKKFKTDQFSKGARVFVGKTGCSLCPVAAVMNYMAARGTSEGPFFQLKSGSPYKGKIHCAQPFKN